MSINCGHPRHNRRRSQLSHPLPRVGLRSANSAQEKPPHSYQGPRAAARLRLAAAPGADVPLGTVVDGAVIVVGTDAALGRMLVRVGLSVRFFLQAE